MRVPKYRLHSVRDVGFVEISGHRYYLPGAYNSAESRAAYQLKIAEHFGNLAKASVGMPSSYLVDELVADYLDHLLLTFGKVSSTYRNTRMFAKKWLRWASGLQVSSIGPNSLRKLQDELLADGLARSTINLHVSVFVTAVKWAVSHERVSVNTLVALRTVPGLRYGKSAAIDHPNRTPVDWETVRITCGYAHKTVADMLLFQWHTGARCANVCDAHSCEFDVTSEPWAWRPRKHKTKNRGIDLTIWIGPQARELISSRLTGDLVFPKSIARFNRQNGRGYSSRRYNDELKKAIEKAKADGHDIPVWSSHQLRHAKSTFLASKHGLEAAQASLGHASISSTQVYSSRLSDLAKRISELEG